MDARTVVITGGSSGIGAAAARALAAEGDRVIPLGRDPERTAAVARSVGAEPMVADFADLAAVRRVATRILETTDRIDVLALNAGGMAFERHVTADAVVLTCSVAAHAGTVRLDDLDRRHRPYRGFGAYADSKLAALLFMRELARRTAGTGLTATAYHPGTADTGFASAAGGRLAAQQASGSPVLRRLAGVRPPEDAAATLIRIARMRRPRGLGGHYLGRDGREAVLPRGARNRGDAVALWEESARLIAVP